MNAPSMDGQLEIAVAAAIDVLDAGNAESVHVVTGTRPTFVQLNQAREMVKNMGCTMTVMGTGGVIVRRMTGLENREEIAGAAGYASLHRPGWFDHLLDMREGVR